MKKQGNWYKLLGMLSVAFMVEQDAVKGIKPKKVGDKGYWPKYSAMPKGCKVFEFGKKFKTDTGEFQKLSFCVVASNQKTAQKKYDRMVVELKAWDGSQKELSHIIKNYNQYCAPIKVII